MLDDTISVNVVGVFQILNGYENIDSNIVSSLKKDNRTRGHEVT